MADRVRGRFHYVAFDLIGWDEFDWPSFDRWWRLRVAFMDFLAERGEAE